MQKERRGRRTGICSRVRGHCSASHITRGGGNESAGLPEPFLFGLPLWVLHLFASAVQEGMGVAGWWGTICRNAFLIRGVSGQEPLSIPSNVSRHLEASSSGAICAFWQLRALCKVGLRVLSALPETGPHC